MHRQGIPALDLWVEQGTDNVPDDGKYHVVHQGRIISSHAREAAAVSEYNRLKQELNADAVATPSQVDHADLLRRERVHHEAQAVLSESGRRRGEAGRRKGGKGR